MRVKGCIDCSLVYPRLIVLVFALYLYPQSWLNLGLVLVVFELLYDIVFPISWISVVGFKIKDFWIATP